MTKLHDLYEQQGQSPWLDNLRRDYLRGGRLAELVGEGIRGVTSNPTIFAKAIEAGNDYDEQFKALLASHTIEEAYWELVITDIRDALAVLRPVYDASAGIDGFVSLEVAPSLAHDTDGTISAARHFHELVAEPNLYVKIPATAEGVPAIRAMLGEGRSINITLLFSLERYGEVIEAYIGGLEDLLASGATDLSRVRSVASFFVSRVDTEVDRRLDTLAADATPERAQEILARRGTAAVAQARRAYALFAQRFSGPRWEALAAKGATVQRPLWASTSTKNPAYPDLAYVDTLIGPDTVNTMPDDTIAAFLDHGTVARTVDADPDAATEALADIAAAGVDMADVGRTLEDEGVASFTKSFDELLQSLSDKANALSAGN
jgi:transaldolase